jgi:predicted aspartyl protease
VSGVGKNEEVARAEGLPCSIGMEKMVTIHPAHAKLDSDEPVRTTVPEWRNASVGMFKVTVKITNPAHPDRSFLEDFWVDTGALYTFVPEDRLEEIGLEPLRARDVILADGRKDRRLLGEALLTIPDLDETLTCPVIFAPKGSLYLLGATALENFGVDVDPLARRLRPISAVIGGYLASRQDRD